jgi:hypothetical protein
MPPERLQPLIQRFGEYILRQPIYVRALGLNMA